MPPEKDKKDYGNSIVLFHEVMGIFSENLRPVIDYLYSIDDDEVRIYNLQKEIDNKIIQSHKTIIHKELYRFETILSIHESEFITGKKISLVDICIYPTLAHLVRFGYPLKGYSR